MSILERIGAAFLPRIAPTLGRVQSSPLKGCSVDLSNQLTSSRDFAPAEMDAVRKCCNIPLTSSTFQLSILLVSGNARANAKKYSRRNLVAQSTFIEVFFV